MDSSSKSIGIGEISKGVEAIELNDDKPQSEVQTEEKKMVHVEVASTVSVVQQNPKPNVIILKRGRRMIVNDDDEEKEEASKAKKVKFEKTKSPESSEKKRSTGDKLTYSTRAKSRMTCTKSYQLLPVACDTSNTFVVEDELDLIASEVLNNECIIAIPETASFKDVSSFERAMTDFEDERFEIDMCLERIKSTMSNVKEFKGILDQNPDFTYPINIQDYLTSMSLKCVKKLYNGRFEELLDRLRSNPKEILPKILSHLEGKKNECIHLLTNVIKITK